MSRIIRRLGRSQEAIRARAYALQLPDPMQGYHSLRQVAAHLGYSIETVRKVATNAGITLRRRPLATESRLSVAYRPWAITDDQIEELRRELDRLGWPEIPCPQPPPSVWGVSGRPEACELCSSTSRPHFAKGLCKACYRTEMTHGRLGLYQPVRRAS